MTATTPDRSDGVGHLTVSSSGRVDDLIEQPQLAWGRQP
jgi:hypothetical protein